MLERDMDGEDLVSLGELYGNMTRFIGFESCLNAGKTMTLAAFGNPERFADVPLIERLPNGRLFCPIRNEYFHASEEIRRYFKARGHVLPAQRDASSVPISQLWLDLAAAVQSQLEEALLHKVRHWVEETKIRSLCLAGGVALNCIANRRVLEEIPLDRIYVQPNSGDQGQGLGNALYGWHHVLGRRDAVKLPGAGVYLGGAYSREECLAAVESAGWRSQSRLVDDLAGETAKLAELMISLEMPHLRYWSTRWRSGLMPNSRYSISEI
jgi:carbamoyltransferase